MATKVNLGEKVCGGLFHIGDVCLVNEKMCVLVASIYRPEGSNSEVYMFRTLDIGLDNKKPSFIHLGNDFSLSMKVGNYASIDKDLIHQGKMVCDTDYMYDAAEWWKECSKGAYLFSSTL